MPEHEPISDVGVTIYSTVPCEEELGFVRIWLIVVPLPALAPVTLPEIVPIVQTNVLGEEAANVILGLVPLQIVAVLADVTVGIGTSASCRLFH